MTLDEFCKSALSQGLEYHISHSRGYVPAGLVEEIVAKHRPICIDKDGIELVDDVGGIGGFCRMLRTIYEADIYNDEDMQEREEMLGWAEMMGWTGRRISPKQTL